MKKILVADDEMSIRLLYSEELKEEGYEVYMATNGREALEIVEKDPPGPGDPGYQDAGDGWHRGPEANQKGKPDLPVVLSTAYDYKQDFATWAADDYLVKSSDLEDLISTVKKHLKE